MDTGTSLRQFICPGQQKGGGGSKGDHLLWRVQGSTSSPTGIGSRRRVRVRVILMCYCYLYLFSSLYQPKVLATHLNYLGCLPKTAGRKEERKEGRKEGNVFMMHSTHFIYGYMASDIR